MPFAQENLLYWYGGGGFIAGSITGAVCVFAIMDNKAKSQIDSLVRAQTDALRLDMNTLNSKIEQMKRDLAEMKKVSLHLNKRQYYK